MSLFEEECAKCGKTKKVEEIKKYGKKNYCLDCYNIVKTEDEKRESKEPKKPKTNEIEEKFSEIEKKIESIKAENTELYNSIVVEFEKFKESITQFIPKTDESIKKVGLWLSNLKPSDLADVMSKLGFNKNKIDRICISSSKKGTNRGKNYRDTQDILNSIYQIYQNTFFKC